MFIKKITDLELLSVEKYTKEFAFQTYEYLKKGGYVISYFHDVAKNIISYAAVAKDRKDCYLHLAEPYLAFSISSTGMTSETTMAMYAPFLYYLHEIEKNLSDEQLHSLYKEVCSLNELVTGLSSEQATKKIEDRKNFNDFLARLERVKEVKKEEIQTNDKLSCILSFTSATEYDDEDVFYSITLMDDKKNYEIKDLYKFLTGFKQREEYALSTKRKIILEPMTFISPYDRALPLLSSSATFYKKAKTSTHIDTFENLLPIFDVLHNVSFDFNGKRIRIEEKDPVSFYLDEKGVPHFTPERINGEEIKTLNGKNGVYQFNNKESKILYYPFVDNNMKESYLYFDSNGVEDFSYIQDLFTDKLLPKLSASLKKKKQDKKEEVKPFEIALYLTVNEENGLHFKTLYFEKGEEVKEVSSILGQSMKSAYLSVLASLGGKENGAIKKQDDVVSFLSKDLAPLMNLASFYCDERLKPNKLVHNMTSFSISTKRKGDYLSMTLDSEEYTKEELQEILAAYHQKKKYFLLKDSFLFLEGDALKEAADIFSDDKTEEENVPLYKLFSLNGLNVPLKQDESCKEVLSKIKNFHNHDLQLEKKAKDLIRPYQEDGVKYLLTLHDFSFGGILADEMGLGKTFQTICYINALEENSPVLIITPKAVLYNWESEIRKFSSMKCVVIDSNREEREKTIKSISPKKKVLYLVSYDTFKRDEEHFSNIEFSTIVLDEAQSIKNSLSKRHQALLSLRAKNRIALTGTPLENSPLDLWSIFDFLMPGYLGKESEFESLLSEKDSNKKLSLLLKPFMLRRRKEDVLKDLPKKTESNILISMSESERMMYLAYLDKARSQSKENKISILASLTRLRQLCVDPSSFLENFDRSTKLSYCRDLLKETISNGHKAIVFSSFKSALLDLKTLLEEEEIPFGVITGDTDGKERLALAENFNAKDDIKVLLVSLKAGGVGLNLIGADTVIHLDPWWNPQVENQASDRVHRIGQKNAVTILRLIMKDTVEEKVLNLQNEKKDLYDEIVEGNGGVSSLSDEDILYLLS